MYGNICLRCADLEKSKVRMSPVDCPSKSRLSGMVNCLSAFDFYAGLKAYARVQSILIATWVVWQCAAAIVLAVTKGSEVAATETGSLLGRAAFWTMWRNAPPSTLQSLSGNTMHVHEAFGVSGGKTASTFMDEACSFGFRCVLQGVGRRLQWR
jgi:hypothetical protein